MPARITASNEALFRYLVVSAVLTRRHRGSTPAAAVREVAGEPFPSLQGRVRRVSERTIYRWLAAWASGGMPALEIPERTPGEASAVLTASLLQFLVKEKEADPRASVPELLKRARERAIITPDEKVDRVTAWRALRRLGVDTRRRKWPHDGDTRRFEYPHRMQMLLCDGKHFRAGATRTKRVALFFLDDASRFGLDAIVGTSESEALFLTGLYRMIRKNGVFDAAFFDGGPGFKALGTAEVFQSLDALLVIGTAGYPEGHGKIERFNQTALNAVLRSLDGQPEVDPDCGALTLRLRHWLREVYNHEKHESLGMTPWERWSGDERALQFPKDDGALRAHFVVRETRRVTNDHTVSFEGVDLEIPKGHAGETVELHVQLLDGAVSIVHDGKLVRLHPVDKHLNAVSGRGSAASREPAPTAPPPPSAASMAYHRDLRPLIGPDGGFSDPEPR